MMSSFSEGVFLNDSLKEQLHKSSLSVYWTTLVHTVCYFLHAALEFLWCVT